MITIDKIKITVILLLLSFQNLKGQLLQAKRSAITAQ